MMQIIKQTDEEKMAMYMKITKKKLAEMLIKCNKVLDTQYGVKVFSSNAVLKVTSDSIENKKESEVAVCPRCKSDTIEEKTLLHHVQCSDCGVVY